MPFFRHLLSIVVCIFFASATWRNLGPVGTRGCKRSVLIVTALSSLLLEMSRTVIVVAGDVTALDLRACLITSTGSGVGASGQVWKMAIDECARKRLRGIGSASWTDDAFALEGRESFRVAGSDGMV